MDDSLQIILVVILILLGVYLWFGKKTKTIVKEKFKNSPKEKESRSYKSNSEFFSNSEHSPMNDIRGGNNIKKYVDPPIFTFFEDSMAPELFETEPIKASTDAVDIERGDWETNYGLPLVTDPQKRAFAKKLIDENKKYANSFSSFHDYLTDESTLIRPPVIDPFRQPELFKGKKIEDIYNEMTQNVKAKSKNIIGENDGELLYEGDSMRRNNTHQNADYGDAF